jgi:hypothetical protein
MTQSLKYGYNPAFFERLCPALNSTITGFDDSGFIFRVFNNQWPDLELKDRVRQINLALHYFLGEDFPAACDRLVRISGNFQPGNHKQALLVSMILTDYIDAFGSDHPHESRKTRKIVSKENNQQPFTHFLLVYGQKKLWQTTKNCAMIESSGNQQK